MVGHVFGMQVTGRDAFKQPRFVAECSCGWKSDEWMPTAGLASAVHTRHVESCAADGEDAVRVLVGDDAVAFVEGVQR